MFDYMQSITPQKPFGYRIKTTAGHQTRNGYAFVADLLDPNGNKVGTVEQDGNGGPDYFHFTNRNDETCFRDAVIHAYGTFDEEAAAGWMEYLEEENLT